MYRLTKIPVLVYSSDTITAVIESLSIQTCYNMLSVLQYCWLKAGIKIRSIKILLHQQSLNISKEIFLTTSISR